MMMWRSVDPGRGRCNALHDVFQPVKEVRKCFFRENGAVFLTGAERVTLRFVDEATLNVRMTRAGGRGFVAPDSGSVVLEGDPRVRVRRQEQADAVRLATDAMTVMVSSSPLRLGFYFPEGGGPRCLDAPDGGMGWQGVGAVCRKDLPGDVHFYGFGEKTGYLDKRGCRMTMWNTDINPYLPTTDALYMSIPFFIAVTDSQAYGIFLDSPARTCFDMGKTLPNRFSFSTDEAQLNYFFLAGPTIKDVVRQYTRLTGRMALPPLWALGYHQSRYSYHPAEEIEEVARALREGDIPCDAIYLDIHYMDGFRPFTFDPKGFADPKSVTERLAKMGFKIVAIVDPGIKVDEDYGSYKRGLAGGHFVTGPDGQPVTARVWPGDVHFPDFTRAGTRQWWADEHAPLFAAGVAGIWNDMNEPAVFDTPSQTLPLESIHGEPGQEVGHAFVHNIYANLMAEATLAAFARFRPGERPFIISRAGYAGIQRYACNWTGDNSSWWEHLLQAIPMCLNLGLSGQPFVGVDIGGFLFDADPELVTRWTQLGVFMPLFRNHSAIGTRSQEPYALAEPYAGVCREFIKMRYRLLPYLYSLMHEAAITGLPVMRPMVMEFPRDPRTPRLHDQFMFGSDLLVAPVYQPGAECRTVYLPEGNWVDFWTGARHAGGRYLLTEAPLQRIPIYIKQGAIIPMGRVMSHTGEKPQAIERLDLYPPDEGAGCFDLYVDDGRSLAYRRGESGFMRLSYQRSIRTGLMFESRWDWRATPCSLPLGVVRVLGVDQVPIRVVLDGMELAPVVSPVSIHSGAGWSLDQEAGVLQIGVNHLADCHIINLAWAE